MTAYTVAQSWGMFFTVLGIYALVLYIRYDIRRSDKKAEREHRLDWEPHREVELPTWEIGRHWR